MLAWTTECMSHTRLKQARSQNLVHCGSTFGTKSGPIFGTKSGPRFKKLLTFCDAPPRCSAGLTKVCFTGEGAVNLAGHKSGGREEVGQACRLVGACGVFAAVGREVQGLFLGPRVECDGASIYTLCLHL